MVISQDLFSILLDSDGIYEHLSHAKIQIQSAFFVGEIWKVKFERGFEAFVYSFSFGQIHGF